MTRSFEGSMPSRWVAVTPSDSTDLTGSIGLYVGTGGTVSARTLGDEETTVPFVSVPAGGYIPGNFTRVMAATTASDILVAYP